MGEITLIPVFKSHVQMELHRSLNLQEVLVPLMLRLALLKLSPDLLHKPSKVDKMQELCESTCLADPLLCLLCSELFFVLEYISFDQVPVF